VQVGFVCCVGFVSFVLFCFVLVGWLVGWLLACLLACLVVVVIGGGVGVVGGGDDVDRHGIDAEASVAGFQ